MFVLLWWLLMARSELVCSLKWVDATDFVTNPIFPWQIYDKSLDSSDGLMIIRQSADGPIRDIFMNWGHCMDRINYIHFILRNLLILTIDQNFICFIWRNRNLVVLGSVALWHVSCFVQNLTVSVIKLDSSTSCNKTSTITKKQFYI